MMMMMNNTRGWACEEERETEREREEREGTIMGSSSSPRGSGKMKRVGKYELGHVLGQGTFAKVRHATHSETGQIVAIKVLDKDRIPDGKMVEQIKREISTMKLVKHPNIVQLHEVMASKTKIYFVLEHVTKGELFSKIAEQGKLTEEEARKYFHQLINAVDYCHSRGVYHRDLKPENLLLDENENLKISDFGLSALPQQLWEDGLLHTTCGTPNYVAPEVIVDRGYDGAKADLWSCGVILFVLMAGYLPFDEPNLMNLYKKIYRADFSCPGWFSSGARSLITRILTPNPKKRITISQILCDPWFLQGYKPLTFLKDEQISLDDVDAVFGESEVNLDGESEDHLITRKKEAKPTLMNAFELISLSKGLNLSGLFEKKQEIKREARFTSTHPAPEILSKMEETAKPLGFHVQRRDCKMNLQGVKTGRKGYLNVATEVFEVAPSLFVVEIQKEGGDTLEYHKFYKNFSTGLKDIVWNTEIETAG